MHSGLLSLLDFGATLDGGNSGDEVEMVADVLAFLRPLSTPTLKETRGERISIHNRIRTCSRGTFGKIGH